MCVSLISNLSLPIIPQLYDLISMAFKYQLMVCPRPEDIVLVTLNHLDSIKSLVADDSQHCHDMVHTACRKLNEVPIYNYSKIFTAHIIMRKLYHVMPREKSSTTFTKYHENCRVFILYVFFR